MKHAPLLSILLAGALTLGSSVVYAQAKEVKFGCYAPMTG